jgi:hypothetical protein
MLGIPFKKVRVTKAVVDEWGRPLPVATLRDYNAYSLKVTGRIMERSIMNIMGGDRYIAPRDLITRIGDKIPIRFGVDASDILSDNGDPAISTIPMPELMSRLNYEHNIEFNYSPIWTINCELENVDVYQTIYIPYDMNMPYRISITGNLMTMEFAMEPLKLPELYIQFYQKLLFTIELPYSKVTCKKQAYGKIIPIDETERIRFIMWATDHYQIYSLGRYATWRPLLLDDVASDIDRILSIIALRSER